MRGSVWLLSACLALTAGEAMADRHDVEGIKEYRLGKLAFERQMFPEAYEHFLLGRQFLNRATADGFRRAIAEYRDAVEREPAYAAGSRRFSSGIAFSRAGRPTTPSRSKYFSMTASSDPDRCVN